MYKTLILRAAPSLASGPYLNKRSRSLLGDATCQIKILGFVVSDKVRKEAKIRKRYNQVPHLFHYTTWGSNKKKQ